MFNSLKQKILIFNFFVNRNWKKLTDSRKRAKILADHLDPFSSDLFNSISTNQNFQSKRKREFLT